MSYEHASRTMLCLASVKVSSLQSLTVRLHLSNNFRLIYEIKLSHTVNNTKKMFSIRKLPSATAHAMSKEFSKVIFLNMSI